MPLQIHHTERPLTVTVCKNMHELLLLHGIHLLCSSSDPNENCGQESDACCRRILWVMPKLGLGLMAEQAVGACKLECEKELDPWVFASVVDARAGVCSSHHPEP